MYQETEEKIMQYWTSDPSKPVVSICTLTYNHGPYIAEAIDSFLMQETDFPFEVLISEDCSTDNTVSIIREYEKKYPTIVKPIYQQENQYSKQIKMNPTFNYPRAKGKYIALCEGDDYWTDPLKLQKQVDFLEEHDDYAISGHDAFIIDENGTHQKDSKLLDIEKKDFDGEDLILNKTWILTLSWLVRREAIKNIPPEYSMVLNGDKFQISLIGHFGKSKHHNDIKPAAYRMHSGGIWSLLTQKEKRDSQINTNFWIYRYYNRIGEKKYANHYLSLNHKLVISTMSNDLIFKEFGRRMLRPLKYLLLRIKNGLFKK